MHEMWTWELTALFPWKIGNLSIAFSGTAWGAPWIAAKFKGLVAALYTPLGDVEEIFNPLGVSLGASES